MDLDVSSLATKNSPENDLFCNSCWCYLPDSVLFQIFQFLNIEELLKVGLVCQSWYNVSLDDFLWRDLFYSIYKVDKSAGLIKGKTWKSEHKRLHCHTPVVQTEILNEHANQVLHVSFSHNGEYFATCSKDGYILVWESSYPAKIKYYHDMKDFCWKYTQYSQFNKTDTLLLVSGVHFGTPHSTSGEIAVFNLEGGFHLQCRVMNKPYDIFGTWYTNQHLLSGDLHWLAHLVSRSLLWVNKANQESNSEHVPITDQLFKFYNTNASSIRSIMVADCISDMNYEQDLNNKCNLLETNNERHESGNPPSHRDITSAHCQSTEGIEDSRLKTNSFTCDYENIQDASCIRYNNAYRQVENENVIYDDSDESEIFNIDAKDNLDDTRSESSSEDNDYREKILIFTTGSKTYTPHQIGFKRLKPLNFPKRIDPGPSIQERLALKQRERELENSGTPRQDPNWQDYGAVAHKFDKVDHLIDLHGHIIGMGLSPDHRYLYVNSRPWPQGYTISNPLDPPPIAQEIDLHVIDLVTLEQVGRMLRSHKAYTPNNECFFIFLDVCNEYVASGAEDRHGYLWDRHYGVCLAKYPHIDVVNSVAFNPQDPEMLVTTSDDYTVKIWRSRSKVKELNLNIDDYPTCIELTKHK